MNSLRKKLIPLAGMLVFSHCSMLGDLFHPAEHDDEAVALGALALYLAGDGSESSEELGEQYSGGETTLFVFTSNAFDNRAANLDDLSRVISFFDGNAVFNHTWVDAPAAAFDGRGPVFNASSCRGCHQKDGRGRPPSSGGPDFQSMLIRISQDGADPTTGGPLAVPGYGTQIQDEAAAGMTAAEASVTITYSENCSSFPDGESYCLRTPTNNITWNYGTPAVTVRDSGRVAPHMSGLGLLSAITEEWLLAQADENDSDGDGISGRPNYAYDHATGTTKIGRFGWKASNPNLTQQNQGAFLGDIGITSHLFPAENCLHTSGTGKCDHIPTGNTGNPFEVSQPLSEALDFYTHLLAVPGRRNWNDATVVQGKEKFNEIGCASCHVPKIKTGTLDGFPEVSNQTIRPYTDLLLHDMGSGLADNRTDFLATGQEWRTPPLWGVGLFDTVNEHNLLLHDGRARGFIEAILWHGGEAQDARDAFYNLPKEDRDAIVTFLEDL